MARKPVLTLTPTELRQAAESLHSMVLRDGFAPQLLVGIETGGARILEVWPAGTPRESCRLQRVSTSAKGRFPAVRRALARLPYFISNVLRRLEDRRGTSRPLIRRVPTHELLEQLESIAAAAEYKDVERVLIVDDAVDSGATLHCVIAAASQAFSESVVIKTAAVTRTRLPEESLAVPDYSIHDSVLCRFPWSFDYREQHGGI